MIQDLRHGVRLLVRAKGWTAVVVLSLALGIGANVAIFGAVNGLLLRTLPGVDRPDTLVRFQTVGQNEFGTDVDEYGPSSADGARATFSTYAFRQFRAANQTLVDLFACAPERQQNVVVDGRAELATGFVATGNYHQLLGVRAEIGRTLTPDDDREDAPQIAVLSHGYWMRRFGGDKNVIGKVLTVNTVPVTVVGVTARDFVGVQQLITEPSDITMPLRLDRQFNFNGPPGFQRVSQATWAWLQVVGRLKPGVTAEQVQANLGGVYQRAARDGWASFVATATPELRSLVGERTRTKLPQLKVSSGTRGIYDVNADTFRSMTLLGIVVGLVLAIVCANVANLLLSRAAARQREIAVRLSLGATRGRLVRQLLTESVLLSAIGAAAGLLVAYWGRHLLPANLAVAAPLDWRVAAFAGGLALATGIVFGIAPAVRSSGFGVAPAVKEGRSSIGRRSRLGTALVVVQVAISLVLLAVAGVFLRTVDNLRRIDVGFDPNNLLLVAVNPAMNRYDVTRIETVYGALLERLPQTPGARAATLSSPTLLGGGASTTNLFIDGRTAPGNRENIYLLTVAPNFFDTMGMTIVAGRGFNERDNRAAQRVIVINETAARKHFPNENPIGRRIGSTYDTRGEREIIGIVSDARYRNIRDAAPPTMFGSYLQARRLDFGWTFAIRTAGDPLRSTAAVREAMREVDPNLAITNVTTQTDSIEQRFAQEKVFAQAYALFGGLAVLIAAVGLFGLMSYSVARRTNEIGIRMALGAKREDVVSMILRESMILVVIGVVIGTAAALGAGRFVATLLFNLAPTDPATIVLSAVLMVVVSALAGYLPARTASRVDPMVALRDE